MFKVHSSKFNVPSNKSAENISQRIFYLLIGLAILVFGLFFLVGYDMPFDENPDFNAPAVYGCAHRPDVAFPDRRSGLSHLFDD